MPVTFTSLKAYRQHNNINVEWKVENEINVKQYKVERSNNGTQFTNLSVIAATGSSSRSAAYQTTDVHPLEGFNYYRIKSIDVNGVTAYTPVVKIWMGKAIDEIAVYPNPVKSTINLKLNYQPAGQYRIRLLNKSGQVIISKQINHAGGSSSETIHLDTYAAHGIYQLEITKPNGEVKTIKVIY
ncbi:MAG: T9SS type A sorting domain-containing protein [Ginsengibacter sp.]